MKRLLNFLLERNDYGRLDFLFIRVGKTSPLLQKLIELSPKDEDVKTINWDLIEVDSLEGFRFPNKMPEIDGIALVLDINDENVSEMRRNFWEYFVWQGIPKPVALVIPDSSKLGSLSKSQVMEALSLQRVTDRPWELFEMGENVETQVFNWLLVASATVISLMAKDEYLKQQEKLVKGVEEEPIPEMEVQSEILPKKRSKKRKGKKKKGRQESQ